MLSNGNASHFTFSPAPSGFGFWLPRRYRAVLIVLTTWDERKVLLSNTKRCHDCKWVTYYIHGEENSLTNMYKEDLTSSPREIATRNRNGWEVIYIGYGCTPVKLCTCTNVVHDPKNTIPNTWNNKSRVERIRGRLKNYLLGRSWSRAMEMHIQKR